MKLITHAEAVSFFKTLETLYDVRVPIVYEDGTQMLGRADEGRCALSGVRIRRKPTDIFFPQYETVFTTAGGCAAPPDKASKPLLAVGFTAADLDCLEFIDRFFSENFVDAPYARRRKNSVIVALTGRCGVNDEFMRIAGGKCDIELIGDADLLVVRAYTAAGRGLEKMIPAKNEISSIEHLQKISDALPDNDRETILKASELMRGKMVPASFWDEIASRCIACTACNMVCPTCTCFDVCDWTHDNGAVERNRLWDSCQLAGFQREAGGHNPMGTETKRTLRRIHHKLVADVERWGFITCMACGRCDDACPTKIGMLAVCKEIVVRFS